MIYFVMNDNKMLIFNKVEISRIDKILNEKGINMDLTKLVPFDEQFLDMYIESLQFIKVEYEIID